MKDKYKIEEYKQLRQDITQRDTSMTQLFLMGLIAIITLLAAISAFFFNTYVKNPSTVSIHLCYFFLAPITIIAPILSIIGSHRKDIRRMGAFIKVFYEDAGLGPTWETGHDQITELDKQEGHDFVPIALWSMLFLCIALFEYGLYIISMPSKTWHVFIPIILIIIMLAIHANYFNSKKNYFKENENIWRQIYSNMHKTENINPEN